MPRLFDVRTDSPASVADIYSAFGDESYWEERIAAFGGGATTLDCLRVDADGTIDVTTTQDLRHDVLPGVLSKAFRGDLSLVRTETWRPAAGGRAQGEVGLSAHGVPGSAVASAELAPLPIGARLSLVGTLEVRIPLLGGRIEKFIGDQLEVEIPQLQQFTSDWISHNA